MPRGGYRGGPPMPSRGGYPMTAPHPGHLSFFGK